MKHPQTVRDLLDSTVRGRMHLDTLDQYWDRMVQDDTPSRLRSARIIREALLDILSEPLPARKEPKEPRSQVPVPSGYMDISEPPRPPGDAWDIVEAALVASQRMDALAQECLKAGLLEASPSVRPVLRDYQCPPILRSHLVMEHGAFPAPPDMDQGAGIWGTIGRRVLRAAAFLCFWRTK